MANSIIESYNHKIKAYFTCGLKFHMLPAVEIFADALQAESASMPEMNTTGGKVVKWMKDWAKKAIDAKQFVWNKDGHYRHTRSKTSEEVVVDANEKSCTCSLFLDKAVCHHLVAVCLMSDLELNGLKKRSKSFRSRYRAERKKPDAEQSDEDSSHEESVNEESAHEEPEPPAALVDPNRGLGRPRKNTPALVYEAEHIRTQPTRTQPKRGNK